MPVNYEYVCDSCGKKAESQNVMPKLWVDLSASWTNSGDNYIWHNHYTCEDRACQIKAIHALWDEMGLSTPTGDTSP